MWKSLAPLVVSCLTASPLFAQTAPLWSQVEGWEIRVDRSLGDGCFAVQSYDDDTTVRIGLDVRGKAIYLLIGNPRWASIEDGRTYRVSLLFDDSVSYQGEMVGRRLKDSVVLQHDNVSGDFLADFRQRHGLKIFYRGVRIASLSLRNTNAAIAEVIACQRQLLGGDDPFAGGPRGRDPFPGGPSRRWPADPFAP